MTEEIITLNKKTVKLKEGIITIFHGAFSDGRKVIKVYYGSNELGHFRG